ncbi:Uncharacterised protein [Streptococcus pneumoniae]|nr:Uncharacterised protein [Streptococcus pneumoniae]VMD64113.1 Uncharacterised protein [Streptococcus pneumoniae]VOD83414.1 Uncharacterised protein [Streptococcus pneumoniae]
MPDNIPPIEVPKLLENLFKEIVTTLSFSFPIPTAHVRNKRIIVAAPIPEIRPEINDINQSLGNNLNNKPIEYSITPILIRFLKLK